ncbi:apolipoprotein N-acyltransferase [Oryzomonas japonica]|uniref:Apolipoprotein N-acyltransferase n=1 Tax=Oryzomonas japonica TaxID=2603858 RepID=A0A7J4ZMY5_9BACT|nr:apolipoprotein N-acyltransferase [Oryzomonas japonica]KAB0664096.1 apolipoprotein N-acyltransferase [Oryzomonas japonica]
MKPSSLRTQLAAVLDRPGLFAIASGVLIALSFPTAGFSFLAWIALIPLLISLEGTTLRQAFRLGFTCGLAAYILILYWINIVVTHFGHLPWAVSIPLYLALAAWLALFYGLATLIARYGEQGRIKLVFTLPVAWVALDFLRSFLLTGFPWAMLGHSQYRILPLIQIADLSGVYGITLLIVLTNVVLYRVLRAVSGANVPYPAKSALLLLLLFTATLFYGFNRLNGEEKSTAPPLRVALIQGNIDQDVKWSPAFQGQTMDIYERLTREAAHGGVDLVVWPESAAPFFFQDEFRQAERIRSLAREINAYVLFGSPAHELRNGTRTFLNSAFVVAPNGETGARGDKMHLVPFGEYVPLKRLLPFVSKLVVGIGDFSPGEHAAPLDVGRTRAGLLVCYEGIFPELAREYVNNGARILVNITNDAWYGRSSAPYQHFSIAVFRAVETRTPLIRAANTGISAIIDQNGHIRAMSTIFQEEVCTGEIQPGSGDSLYLKIGDAPAWFCAMLTLGVVLLARFRREKRLERKD